MNARIEVKSVKKCDDTLELLISNDVILSKLKPKGQLLVDSDQLAFIYIVEDENGYKYVSIGERFWYELKEAMTDKLIIYLENNGDSMELIGFHDELKYLLGNIKGNVNYGNELVSYVQAIFFDNITE